MDQDSYRPRERSRSRRRSRSPRHSRRRSYSPRSRSRSRDGYRRSDRRSRSPQGNGPAPGGYNSYGSSRGGRGPSNYEDRSAQKEQMMQSVKDSSQQDRRVYVGNLSYDVKWHHLKDFMRQAGEVLFADVLLLPNGMSKGCGIVEYQSRDQAQNAINTLSNQNLMGRLVYVREDRETEPRFTGPTGGGRGDFGGGGGFGGRGGYGGGGFGGPPGGAMGGGGRQIYVSNLPYTVGWQDLKDLFRQAAVQGNVIRADVHMGPDGRPKGSGIVAFESPEDAQNAIQQFNGFDWQGRALEVREDRFPQQAMGGPRGGFGGGFGGRGGFGGGFGRGGFGGRGGFQQGGYGGGGFGGGRGGYGGGAGYGGGGAGFGGGPGAGAGAGYGGGRDAAPAAPNAFTDYAGPNGDRSEIIFVRNLPWSTSNEDLIELFQTIGKVEQAEIQYEPNGRSRGTGVVRFDNDSNAASAIEKFTNYQYGGRPLGLSYVRYMDGSGVGEPKQEGMDSGMTQEGMM